MTSTAILSQFSTFQIGSEAGAAKAITGISAANPAVITAVAHGLARGDVVSLAGVVGMTQANGITGVVQYANADTFVLAGLDASAFTPYASGGTASGVAWTTIANIKTFTAFDGAAANIDVSNLQSTAKEYLTGLKDLGQFSLELDLDSNDPGQNALLVSQSESSRRPFKLTLPNNATATFTGLAKKVTASGGVDSGMKRSVDILISGDVTWSV